MKREISVVISVRNDPVGCLFTTRSLLENFKTLSSFWLGEVVIVDGNFGVQITSIGSKRDRLTQLKD